MVADAHQSCVQDVTLDVQREAELLFDHLDRGTGAFVGGNDDKDFQLLLFSGIVRDLESSQMMLEFRKQRAATSLGDMSGLVPIRSAGAS